MTEVAILSHPCTPVEPMELEEWLQEQVDRLHHSEPELVIRFSRLTQKLPDSDITGGWLIDLELPARDRPFEGVADFLTDMRFLGMQPRPMLPLGISELSSALGKAPSAAASIESPVLDYPGLN